MEIDIMAIIQQYAIIPVAAVCVLLGWLLKNTFTAFPNKFIPLALLPVAMVAVLWLNAWAFTPENILAGFCSAALAVYVHQNGKHLIAEVKPPDTGAEAAGSDAQ